jgi:hypothetical protein
MCEQIHVQSNRNKTEPSHNSKKQYANCWKYALEPTGFDSLVGSDGFHSLLCKRPNGPQML